MVCSDIGIVEGSITETLSQKNGLLLSVSSLTKRGIDAFVVIECFVR